MKAAVIFASLSGNTEAMAQAIFEGAKENGSAELFNAEDISASRALGYDLLFLGSPAMGDEVLEETYFEPFFTELEKSLENKKVALFGSYSWGDGQWMRDWCERATAAGAVLVEAEGLMVNETPDDDALDTCRKLGGELANA